MKTPLLIAIIAAGLQVVVSLFNLLLNFRLIDFNSKLWQAYFSPFIQIISIFPFLSATGLFIFFIMFYDKESKK
jgi:hypothetical protein